MLPAVGARRRPSCQKVSGGTATIGWVKKPYLRLSLSLTPCHEAIRRGPRNPRDAASSFLTNREWGSWRTCLLGRE